MSIDEAARERFAEAERRRLWAWTGDDTVVAMRQAARVVGSTARPRLQSAPIAPVEAGLAVSLEWHRAGAVQGFQDDPFQVYVRAVDGTDEDGRPHGKFVAHPVGPCPACGRATPYGDGTTDRTMFAGHLVVGWPAEGHRAVCPTLHR